MLTCRSIRTNHHSLLLLSFTLVLWLASAAGATDVVTYHNDNLRTGQNTEETILTRSNVNSASFGKLFSIPVDGVIDAEPLYLSGVPVPNQGTHNVLYVVTENDTVYAFDADGGGKLWQASLLPNGETPSDSRSCPFISPQIGITATPVIDRTRGPQGAIYVVAMSKSPTAYFQRIHALDITSGQELFGGPVIIKAKFPGNGDNSKNGYVIFDPKQYAERAGLVLVNGVVYTTWTSHCDIRPYTGWIIGYDANTLQRTGVLNVTPNGNEGAIWQSGAGMAADRQGNLYFLDANGTFETTLDSNGFPILGDYGNAFVKLSTANRQLKVVDYFNMFNTIAESESDEDLGSGGALLLPPMQDASGKTRHLALGAGKDQNIYIVNRNNMGKFDTQKNNIYQELDGVLRGGLWSMPAYFNHNVYFGPQGNRLLHFRFTQARLSATPVSQSATSFTYPGSTPSVSANRTSNGIVWAIEHSTSSVLHAYAAGNLGNELYNSNQAPNSRDHFGSASHFGTPLIVNGKVYVGTTNSVAVFGVLP